MIVCVCRNIRESDFNSEQELKERIMKNDAQCKLCQIRYEITKDITESIQSDNLFD